MNSSSSIRETDGVGEKSPPYANSLPQSKMVDEPKYDSGITSENCSPAPSADTPPPSTDIALPPDGEGEATAKSKIQLTKSAEIKQKIIKCKSCDFCTYTKEAYWTHIKIHMNGKILTCSECPFVTQYKHHLKYHLLKHTGAKPVQCEHCDYSCITKSMLTSHMKSHSNVREYRCRDCGFETKYQNKLTAHMKRHSRERATSKVNEEVPVAATSPTSETPMLPFQLGLMSQVVNPELRQKIQFCIWMAQWEALQFQLMKGQPEQEEPLDLSVPKINKTRFEIPACNFYL